MLYTAAHLVSKRTMLYSLNEDILYLAAMWCPSVLRPANGAADEFLNIRVGRVLGECEENVHDSEGMQEDCDQLYPLCHARSRCNRKYELALEAQGAAAQVKAAYYLSYTDEKPFIVDQYRDEFCTVLICARTYLHTVAPRTTLTASTAFTGAVDEATSTFGDLSGERRERKDGKKNEGRTRKQVEQGKEAINLVEVFNDVRLKLHALQVKKARLWSLIPQSVCRA